MTDDAYRPGPFAVKSIDALLAEAAEEDHSLQRAVGAISLTAMGSARSSAPASSSSSARASRMPPAPAVIFAFMLAAIACTFSALSYAELASSIPVSGSAYTYSYATLGEIIAWVIGWDLILEYGVSVAAVAVGWGGNINEFLYSAFGVTLPDAISSRRRTAGCSTCPRSSSCWRSRSCCARCIRESAPANSSWWRSSSGS